MKTTKFRAWYENQMWAVVQMEFREEKSSVLLKHSAGVFAGDDDTDVIFMQSTGLRDKNGTLIYEGDILKSINGLKQIIWNEEWACFMGYSEFGNHGYIYGNETAKWYEIVGNIYESDMFWLKKETTNDTHK